MAEPTREAAGSTISKYIARFRQEKPRPREARLDTRQEDFWWVRRREADSTRSAAMDWEVDLLGDIHGGGDGGPNTSLSLSLSPRNSSDSHELFQQDASPQPSTSSSTNDRSPLRISASMERELSRRRSFSDDDFVMLPMDNRDGVEAPRPNKEDEALAEAALEDPEMVIQRIRRRLGYQSLPPPMASFSASSIDDSPTDANDLFDEMVGRSPCETCDDDAGDLSPLHAVFASSFRIESAHSEYFAPPPSHQSSEDDGATTGPAETQEATSPRTAECHETDLGESKSESGPLSAESTDEIPPPPPPPVQSSDCEAVHADSPASATDEREDIRADVENNSRSFLSFEEWKLDTRETIPPKNSPRNTAASARAKSPSAEHESREKKSPRLPPSPGLPPSPRQPPSPKLPPSPRLPPLSPARSPHFRILGPSPPKSVESVEAEIPAESSKTLDSLLSFVIQSWGENSLLGSDDNDESGTPTDSKQMQTSKSPVAVGSDDSLRLPPPRTENDADPSTTVQTNSDRIGDSELEDKSFDDDPIVSVLRERIALFEEALTRLGDEDAKRIEE